MTLEFIKSAALFVASLTIICVGSLTISIWMLNHFINLFGKFIKFKMFLIEYALNRNEFKKWRKQQSSQKE